MNIKLKGLTLRISLTQAKLKFIEDYFKKNGQRILLLFLFLISLASFVYFLQNGLGLAYNDARSHLNIGRRVLESLKPGYAQLGSVWLPLPHILMLPTVWIDFMWHTGLSGAIQSMASYIYTSLLIFYFLKKFKVNNLLSVTAVLLFALNPNVLYMQSTAMTELLLLATMTAGVYELVKWHSEEKLLDLIKAAFWIMLATLIRYDGWFLFLFSIALISLHTLRKRGFAVTKGVVIFFTTLAAFGVGFWLLWNLMIFKDPLYFILGPYSARAQQSQLEQAGVLVTKGNIILSTLTYIYAMFYNANGFVFSLGAIGGIIFWFDKKIPSAVRYGSLALISPLIFNILALFLGHSVLFVEGLTGNSWFNVRYGLMMLPTIVIFLGYFLSRIGIYKYVLIGLLAFVTAFSLLNYDAVSLDDAVIGSSGKNVTEVSGWLRDNASNEKGFVLISVASHDAIIFSSGMPMKRFIHEGTGIYWENAISKPEKWAKWIIMRTNDENDLTFRSIKKTRFMDKYVLIDSFPFADIYQLKKEYFGQLITQPILGRQK